MAMFSRVFCCDIKTAVLVLAILTVVETVGGAGLAMLSVSSYFYL